MIKILFICIHNAARSQMAEAYARKLGKGRIEAFSAGSKPAKHIDLSAVLAMKEENIDILNAYPKGFGELPSKEFNYVVSLGCGDACPTVKAKKHITWEIPNPRGRNLATYRKVRDNIKEHVYQMVQFMVNYDRKTKEIS